MIAFSGISQAASGQTGAILAKADSLMQVGEHRLALHEYERYNHYHPQQQFRVMSHEADCHFMLQEYRSAIRSWQGAAALRETGKPQKDSALFAAAVAAFMLEEYSESLGFLETVSPAARDSSNYLGCTLMKCIVLNAQGRFEEGKQKLLLIAGRDAHSIALMDSVYRKALRYHPHSPGFAVVLSLVVPGAGQVYAGKPLDGLLSLGLTGGSAALGTYSFVQGHYFFTFITCLLLLEKFYTGGARYAANLARQRSEDRLVKKVKGLNDTILGIWGSQ